MRENQCPYYAYKGLLMRYCNQKKENGVMTLTTSSKEFRQQVIEMELIDMPLVGRKFTWFKGKSYSRLGGVMVEIEWLEAFKNLKV